MSNFEFLAEEWAGLAEPASRAEALAVTDPRACCFYARRALEQAVRWMYRNDAALSMPFDDSLSALLHEPTFGAVAPPLVKVKAKLVKDLGNQAVHSER